MRIKEIVLASSLICVPLFGQNCASTPSTGTPLNLALPVVNCTQWNVQLNTNFSTINSFAATVALLSPTTSQMFTQPASTFTGFNAFQAVGSPSAIGFGPVLGSNFAFLSNNGSGTFSLDTTAIGNGLATLTTGGYQLNGAAPLNHILVGNGNIYADSASVPTSALPTLFYQTVDLVLSPRPQRPVLNFTARFTATDVVSPPFTSIDLNASGTGNIVPTELNSPGSSTNCAQYDGNGNIGPTNSACVHILMQSSNLAGSARTFGATFQNTTGFPLYIQGFGTTSGSSVGSITCADGLSSPTIQIWATEFTATESGAPAGFNCLIPNGFFYSVTASGAVNTLAAWYETF